jgi:hypothetical protein
MKTNTLTAARELAAQVNRSWSVGKAGDCVKDENGKWNGNFISISSGLTKTFASRKEQCDYLRDLLALGVRSA